MPNNTTESTVKKRPDKTTAAEKRVDTTKKTTSRKTASNKKTSNDKQTTTKKTATEKNVKPITKSNKKINTDSITHVLFVCSEAQPFVGTGGLSDVMGSLPKSINKKNSGVEIRVILPLYESMNYDFRQKLEFMFNINVPLSWRNQYCGVFKFFHEGVTYYFVDNEYYFKRQNIYGHYDDGERFAFFSRAVLEVLPLLDFRANILHCHDWHTALVPIYYKLFYQYSTGYENIRTIYTIHNIEYQGKYDRCILEDVFGISFSEYRSLAFDGVVNLMRGAIDYCDTLTTVSPTYASELCDPYYAYGLDKIVQRNSHKMTGILNGIDTELYDPSTNTSLFANYDHKNISGKAINKTELQKMIGLTESADTPLIAIVSRLVPHKGLELLKLAMNNILSHNIQIVILGTGTASLEQYFSHLQVEYSGKVSTIIAYNKDLSQKIYAGADMFLMPSKGEPCGLSQMIAMRYGTVPIVRATGGLKDSVRDCGDEGGNGFTFHDFDALEMTRAIERATDLYRNNKDAWTKLIDTAMNENFTWDKSADEYIKLYK